LLATSPKSTGQRKLEPWSTGQGLNIHLRVHAPSNS
jgi:hypothetical protein